MAENTIELHRVLRAPAERIYRLDHAFKPTFSLLTIGQPKPAKLGALLRWAERR